MTAPAQTAPATGAKTKWKLDPTHTMVEFSAKHLMITTVKGRIADVEGNHQYRREKPRRILRSRRLSRRRASIPAPTNGTSIFARAIFCMPSNIPRSNSGAPASKEIGRSSSSPAI